MSRGGTRGGWHRVPTDPRAFWRSHRGRRAVVLAASRPPGSRRRWRARRRRANAWMCAWRISRLEAMRGEGPGWRAAPLVGLVRRWRSLPGRSRQGGGVPTFDKSRRRRHGPRRRHPAHFLPDVVFEAAHEEMRLALAMPAGRRGVDGPRRANAPRHAVPLVEERGRDGLHARLVVTTQNQQLLKLKY